MNEDARSHLEELLDREIDAAHALAAALEEERKALTGTSPQTIEEKAAEKIHLLGAIEKLEDERRALAAVAEQALPGARVPQGSSLAATVAERWRKLMELMAGCRTSNEINGYIINLRQGQIRQLIGVVRGGAPLTTYTSQGRTFARALRPLAKA
jgi:flagellar biosynthesis/type III secretory pathway chaperone